jgi:uncharacterized protein (TIGR00255 family)
MTGFATGGTKTKAHGIKLSFTVEIKTFNSRFFEVVCKLPAVFNSLEVKIVTLLQAKLLRGRVYLSVRFNEDNEAFEDTPLSFKVVSGYLSAAKMLKQKFKLSGDLTISDILKLPDVFVQERGDLTQEEETLIFKAIEDVANRLNRTRQEEGARLEKDFLMRFDLCAKRIKEIEKRFKNLMIEHKTRLDKQLSLVQQGDENAKQQAEDLYAELNKIDIQEEITRFNSHLVSISNVIKDKKQIDKGKRLDFILQELLREINTLMAKCSSFSISSLSVDIKVELEKAREQVQNIV